MYGMESTPANILINCDGHKSIELSQELVQRSGTLAKILKRNDSKNSISLSGDSYKEIKRFKKIMSQENPFQNLKSLKKFKYAAQIVDKYNIADLHEECAKTGKVLMRAFSSSLPHCATRLFEIHDVSNFSEIKKNIKQSAQKIYQHMERICKPTMCNNSIIFIDCKGIHSLDLSGSLKNSARLDVGHLLVAPHLQKLIMTVGGKVELYTYDFKKIKQLESSFVSRYFMDFKLSYDEKKIGYFFYGNEPLGTLIVDDLESGKNLYKKDYCTMWERNRDMKVDCALHMVSPEIANSLHEFIQKKPRHDFVTIIPEKNLLITRKSTQVIAWDLKTLQKKKGFYTDILDTHYFGESKFVIYNNSLIIQGEGNVLNIWDITSGSHIMTIPIETSDNFYHDIHHIVSHEHNALFVFDDKKSVWKYDISSLP